MRQQQQKSWKIMNETLKVYFNWFARDSEANGKQEIVCFCHGARDTFHSVLNQSSRQAN